MQENATIRLGGKDCGSESRENQKAELIRYKKPIEQLTRGEEAWDYS